MLQLVWEGDDRKGNKVRVLKDKPTLGSFFVKVIDEQDRQLKRRLRFMAQYFRGSIVYYLETEGLLVAYLVVTKGGGRYSYTTSKDIVITPIFVKEEYRGNRYSEMLIHAALNDEQLKYEKALDWIKKNNIPSLKASLKCGLRIVSSVRLNNRLARPFKLLIKDSDDRGDWWLLCATRKE